MSTPDRSIPEWDFFGRIDDLELTSADTEILAKIAFMFLFIDVAGKSSNPRKTKDELLDIFKKLGLSTDGLSYVEMIMLDTCERLESDPRFKQNYGI